MPAKFEWQSYMPTVVCGAIRKSRTALQYASESC